MPGAWDQAIQDGTFQPTIWSPGEISPVDLANQLRKDRGQPPLVSEACPPIVYAATGFAMWRPMAEALGWPDQPIGWDEIVALSADPQGWGSYGHPEWGAFKFGHAHPEHSTTGLTMLATLAYNALDRTDGLTPELVKSDPVREAFRAGGGPYLPLRPVDPLSDDGDGPARPVLPARRDLFRDLHAEDQRGQ